MVNKLIDIAFSGFFSFCGVTILLTLVMQGIGKTALGFWTRFLRMIMVRKHGWPPSHLDADGDWKPINEEEDYTDN